MMAGTPKGAKVEIDFKARIKRLQGDAWDTTIQLRHKGDGPEHENQAITQEISLSHNHEFAIESRGGTTLVRPVLISFFGISGQ